MKKITAIIGSLFLLYGINAQDCNKEVIMNVKGKWTALANNIVYPEKTFPSNQYSQLYTRLDKIANLFQQAYPQPTGIEAKWYRSIRGAAIVKNGPAPLMERYRFCFYSCRLRVSLLDGLAILSSLVYSWLYWLEGNVFFRINNIVCQGCPFSFYIHNNFLIAILAFIPYKRKKNL